MSIELFRVADPMDSFNGYPLTAAAFSQEAMISLTASP